MCFDGFVVYAVFFQILDWVHPHQYDSEMNGYYFSAMQYQLCPMPLCTKASNFIMAEVAVLEWVDHTHTALVLLFRISFYSRFPAPLSHPSFL